MANIRIVYNNVADSAATITANSNSGTLVAANLLTDLKSQVHRSTNTSVTYNISWNSAQTVGCVAMPCTNLSSTATIAVRLYSDAQASSLVYNSGTLPAVPGYNIDPKAWPTGINVNTFVYGGSVKTVVWITSKPDNIRSAVIDISDPANPLGYVDSARLVVGDYWSPTFNIQNGAQFEFVDNSEATRRDSGDLVVDRSFTFDKFNFDFSLLPDTDKSELLKIIRSIGVHKNIFISLFPDSDYAKMEQDSMIYGKRSNSSIQYQLFGYYAHSMELTGW